MTTKHFTKAFCMILMLAGIVHVDVFAQTIHYQTETKSKFHMLGNLSGLVGNKPIVSDVYMTKDYMLDTDKNDATLFSVVDEKITFMNKKKKTYYEMTFDDMASYVETLQQDMSQEMDQAEQEGAEVDFDFSVEDKGETMKISGHSANRKLMTIEVNFSAEETDDDGYTQTASGTMYTLVDMWVSTDVPGYEVMKEYSESYAESLGESFSGAGGMMGGLAQMMQQDPRMGAAMQKAQEEMQKIDGVTLKSNTFIVMVPEGMELDVDAAMSGGGEQSKEAKKEKRKRGLDNLARGALRGQGINIANEEAPPEEAQPETQQVMMEMETIYKVFEKVDDDPARFTVPSKYKKVARPGY